MTNSRCGFMGYRMTMVLSRMPMPMPNGSHIPTFLLHKPQGIFLKPLFVHSAPAAPAFVWGIALKTSTFMSMFAGRARNANVKSNSNSNSNSNSSSNLNHNVVSEMDDLSVFRFTLGIVGFDESYLPRIIGILFGFLLVLNHVFTQTSVTAAQLRSELAGALLAAIAITLPYVGKRLQTGMSVARQQNLSADCREVFLISEYLSDVDKEDLAWGSYAVLRNTVSSSLLIYHSELLCARGCWDIPVKVSKDDIFTLLECEIDQMGLSYVTTTLYFPDNVDRQGWERVPKGTASLLVQPFNVRVSSNENLMQFGGFILLLSSIPQAYGDKERAWVAALATKFQNIKCTIRE